MYRKGKMTQSKRQKRAAYRRRRAERRGYGFLKVQNEHVGWLDKLLRFVKGENRK